MKKIILFSVCVCASSISGGRGDYQSGDGYKGLLDEIPRNGDENEKIGNRKYDAWPPGSSSESHPIFLAWIGKHAYIDKGSDHLSDEIKRFDNDKCTDRRFDTKRP